MSIPKNESHKYLWLIASVFLSIVVGWYVEYKLLLIVVGLIVGYICYRLFELIIMYLKIGFRHLKDKLFK